MRCGALAAVAAVLAQPASAAFAHTQTLDKANGVVLQWNYDAAAGTVALRLEAAVPANKTGGWLGVGWSPSGKMSGGDFVMGYDKCSQLRVTSLPTGSPPPNGPAGVDVSNSSFSIEGGKMVLSFTRPVAAKLPGHNAILTDASQCVLFAAADASRAPASCDAPLAFSNAHNLFQGSAQVSFAGKVASPQDKAYQFNATLNYEQGVQLEWTFDTAAEMASFKISGRAPPYNKPGWIGLGFLPSNQQHMQGGDFAIGFGECVRYGSLAEPKWYGPPVASVGFQAGCGSSSVSTVNGTMSLTFSRGFGAAAGHQKLLTSGAQWLAYAMANEEAVPKGCGDKFTMKNGHNMYQGFAQVELSTGKLLFPTPP